MPALAKTTSYVYKGDEEAARKLLGLANLQLMKLRNLMAFNNLDQYALTVYNKVGAYIKVSSIFGNEVAEVFYPKIKGVPEEVLKRKRIMRMKIAQDWTLLYAPVPAPDAQDWGGWLESGKTDLTVDNFLNTFGLIGFGWPIWGDFVATNISTTNLAGTYSVEDGGWTCPGDVQPGVPSPLYIGMYWIACGICRKITTGNTQNVTYKFPADLVPEISAVNSGSTGQKCWVNDGGIYDHPDGYVWIPSNAYGVTTPPRCTLANKRDPAWNDPGYTQQHIEGYISWQSTYMLGFWKQEWTVYNPSSYVDKDNYVLFYDKYVSDSYVSTSRLNDLPTGYCNVHAFLYDRSNYYTSRMKEEYIGVLGSGDCNHITFPFTVYNESHFGAQVYVHDPDSNEYSDTSRGTITYETHVCGKYEGVYFDEVVGTATWTGAGTWGASGAWSGNNVFPWMGRMYHKSELKEGTTDEPDKTSEHNLLLYSYLVGPAAGYPSVTDKVPGCTGITQTVYRMRHGATNITKTYVASHPGWHTVWTDPSTGRLWRAYGDLFAALKATSIKDIELGQPEWIDWWYADGSQFIIEEDDN